MTRMRRVRVTFWGLVAAAVVSTGVLMRAVAWRASPATGVVVAVSGVVTVLTVALAARILIVVGRGR